MAIIVISPGLLTPAVVRAGPSKVDPRDIALTPTDLPPGFVVVPEKTKYEPLKDAPGVTYLVVMERPLTAENIRTGPVYVGQLIGRIDSPVSFEGFLDRIRQRSINEDGFSLVPDRPNDGGTASLMKIHGDVAAYEVGFIKQDTVVFTRWIGHASVVDLDGVLRLAGISSARYDQVAAAGPPTAAPTSPEAPPAAAASPPPSSSPAAAQEYIRIANTDGQGANLRASPGGSILRVAAEGEVLAVIGSDQTDTDGRTWRNVRADDGTEGWVSASVTVRHSEAAPAASPGPPSAAQAPAAPPPPPPTPTPTAAPTATPTPQPTARPAPTATARPAPQIDGALMPAWRRLTGIQLTVSGRSLGSMFRSMVEQSGVSLTTGPLPAGSDGRFRMPDNIITISSAVLREDSRAIAAVMAHEITHAWQVYQGKGSRLDCVGMEAEAFKVEAITWSSFWQSGFGPNRTRLENNLNELVYILVTEGDPGFYKLVVDNPGYQQNCRLWTPR